MIDKIKKYIKRGLTYTLHGQPIQNITAEIKLLESSAKLADKKVLITGGSRGLGKAIAKMFVEEGAQVVITGRNIEKLQEISKELRCKYLVVDLTDVFCLSKLIEDSAQAMNGLNVLINNAGISLHEWEIEKVTVAGYDAQFNTNLRAPYFLCQHFIRYVLEHKEKANILFMSSERSQTADIIPYGLTKAAINSLVQGLAKKYRDKGIRVNAVAPGVTASDMTGYDENSNLYFAGNSNNRIYLPSEIAEVTAFLVSDASSCLTGQILVCNEAKTINAYF